MLEKIPDGLICCCFSIFRDRYFRRASKSSRSLFSKVFGNNGDCSTRNFNAMRCTSNTELSDVIPVSSFFITLNAHGDKLPYLALSRPSRNIILFWSM